MATVTPDASLLPCPFCGGPCATSVSVNRGISYFAVGCVTMGCREFVSSQCIASPNREAMAAAWNTRATPKPIINVKKMIDHYTNMSGLFMPEDIRGPMMAEAALDFQEALDRK